MISKNTSGQGVYLLAFDTTANAPKTGDGANITGIVSLDGAAGSALGTTHPTEIGNGLYWQPLAQAETNGNLLGLAWTSVTSGVLIDPLEVTTVSPAAKVPATLASTDVTGKLPSTLAAADVSGLLPVADPSGVTTLLGRVPGIVQPQSGDVFALIGTAGAGLTAVRLAAAGLDSVMVETTVNIRQALAPILASAVGLISGVPASGAGTVLVKSAGGTTRASIAVDGAGNRTSSTLNLPS